MARKFRVSKTTLHKTKKTAEKKAESLRRSGYRAEVHPSQKATQKKSPSLKWTVLKGQLQKKILPTNEEKRRALKKLDKDYVAYKSSLTKDYNKLVKTIKSAKASKSDKDRELAKLNTRKKTGLNLTKQRYNREKKRLNAIPSR